MVVMVHNTDLPDPWEREGEDHDYFFRFSPDVRLHVHEIPELREALAAGADHEARLAVAPESVQG